MEMKGKERANMSCEGRSVEIAGQRLKLRYSVNSLCEVEQRAKMPIDRLMDFQFTATRLLLWAGLRDFQPELTVEDVGELIGRSVAFGGTLEEIVDMCAEGLKEAGFFGRE